MKASAATLLLRAHGGNDAGAGHIMRLAALGSAWREAGGRAVLQCAHLGHAFSERLRRMGLELRDSTADQGGQSDAEETLANARAVSAQWIAVDGYVFREPFFRVLGEHRAKVMVVDDHAVTAPSYAQIVVDPAFQASEGDYRERLPAARLLMGPRYALLRREFRLASTEIPDPKGPMQRLLVTMGGSDPDDTSSCILRAIAQTNGSPNEVVLVVGDLNRRSDEHFYRKAGSLKLTVRRNVENMADVMRSCDGAISAGGITLQELAALGVPSLLVPIAENQRAGLRYVHQRGWFTALAPIREMGDDSLTAAIERWLSDPSGNREKAAKVASVIDGRGAERICETLMAA